MCLSYVPFRGNQLNICNWKMVVEQWRLISYTSHSNHALSCKFLLSSDCISSMVEVRPNGLVNHKTVILTLTSVITWNGTSDLIVIDVHQLKCIDDGRIYCKINCMNTWEEVMTTFSILSSFYQQLLPVTLPKLQNLKPYNELGHHCIVVWRSNQIQVWISQALLLLPI